MEKFLISIVDRVDQEKILFQGELVKVQEGPVLISLTSKNGEMFRGINEIAKSISEIQDISQLVGIFAEDHEIQDALNILRGKVRNHTQKVCDEMRGIINNWAYHETEILTTLQSMKEKDLFGLQNDLIELFAVEGRVSFSFNEDCYPQYKPTDINTFSNENNHNLVEDSVSVECVISTLPIAVKTLQRGVIDLYVRNLELLELVECLEGNIEEHFEIIESL